jgi:hypothetical protein
MKKLLFATAVSSILLGNIAFAAGLNNEVGTTAIGQYSGAIHLAGLIESKGIFDTEVRPGSKSKLDDTERFVS